jgi:arylsulfatase A-like enzyme
MAFDRQAYWKYKNQKAVRDQQFKLLIEGENTFLFNLNEDPEERFNLLEEDPEVAFDMEEQFRQWEIMIKSKQYE